MSLNLRHVLLLAACIGLLPAAPSAQQSPAAAPSKDLIAVMDLEAIGANKVEATAMTDRLREELLKGGRFTLVDRSQMEAVLAEQALQQAGCTSQECAVKVGKTLGVRKIVVGRVTKVSDNIWQVSAQLIDVETSETQRAESIRHRGDFFTLLDRTIVELAQKLGQGIAVAAAPAAKPAEPPPAPTPDGEKPRRGWYVGAGITAANVSAKELDGTTVLRSTSGKEEILLGKPKATGTGYNLVAGYRFNPLSVEFLLATTTHEAKHDAASNTAQASVTTAIFDVRYSFPLSGPWEAFVLGGSGAYSVTYDTYGLTVAGKTEGKISGGGFSVGGGAEYLRGSLLLRAALVHHSATLNEGEVSGSTQTLASPINLSVTSVMATAGYRF